MARNTPTEILDDVKKLLVKDIITLWDTANINNNGDAVFSRTPLFYNQDITIYKSNVTESMDNLYKNASFIEYLKIIDLIKNEDYVNVSRIFSDKFNDFINYKN